VPVDRRAVLAGVCLQAGALAALAAAGLPAQWYAAAVPVGGFATGLASDNFEREFLDAALATVLGAAAALAGVVTLLLVRASSLSPVARADLAFVFGTHGLAALLAVLPFLALAGAAAGHLGGTLRRARRGTV
jgi:hypothetical protein